MKNTSRRKQMFDMLKNMFKKSDKPLAGYQPVAPALADSPDMIRPELKPKKPRKPRAKKTKPVAPELTAKEQATLDNEPYIAITKVDVDPSNISNGAFELDWNDKFVINLIKSGYKLKPEDTDADIVDRWFTQVCRNVALEVYEQQEADPDWRNQMRVVQTKDLGGGRTEVS
jgi:hypothetical protein